MEDLLLGITLYNVVRCSHDFEARNLKFRVEGTGMDGRTNGRTNGRTDSHQMVQNMPKLSVRLIKHPYQPYLAPGNTDTLIPIQLIRIREL